MELKTVVKIITMLDVVLAAVLITLYVSLLSDHLQELQLEKRSKRDHVILYIYVCVFVLVQLFLAFRFYRVLSFTDDNEDVGDQLRIAKFWTFASYLILLNFVIKTGVYSKRCSCALSISLVILAIAIFFRICAIYVVREYIKKLEKIGEEISRKEKLRKITGQRDAQEQNHRAVLSSILFERG